MGHASSSVGQAECRRVSGSGRDEDGGWYASIHLRPGVAAFGDGPTQEAAIADPRVGLELLIEEAAH
jgi:predicted RNase H-like HicB family nuclease